MEQTLKGFAPETAVIAEMTGVDDKSPIQVDVDPKVLKELTEGDPDPMFVTIEAINEGVSRNGRNWTREAIAGIAKQIIAKKPDGYRGHLTEQDREKVYPEVQTVWLGATAKEVQGKLRLFVKGYVLPEAKSLKSYLRTAKRAGKSVALSVYGTVSKAFGGVADMINFDLESIDWARPGSEAVKATSGLFEITAEMTSNNPKESNVDKTQVLKTATAEEVKEHVPKEVVSEMVSNETADVEADRAEVVAEMTEIAEAAGAEDGKPLLEVVQEMAQDNRELHLDAELREAVENPAARQLVRNLVVAEMQQDRTTPVKELVEGVLKSDTGKSVVAEMVEKTPAIQPAIDRPVNKPSRKFTKKVESKES